MVSPAAGTSASPVLATSRPADAAAGQCDIHVAAPQPDESVRGVVQVIGNLVLRCPGLILAHGRAEIAGEEVAGCVDGLAGFVVDVGGGCGKTVAGKRSETSADDIQIGGIRQSFVSAELHAADGYRPASDLDADLVIVNFVAGRQSRQGGAAPLDEDAGLAQRRRRSCCLASSRGRLVWKCPRCPMRMYSK